MLVPMLSGSSLQQVNGKDQQMESEKTADTSLQ